MILVDQHNNRNYYVANRSGIVFAYNYPNGWGTFSPKRMEVSG